RLDLVARLERVNDQVLEPIGDGRGIWVDDDEHPPPRRVAVQRSLGERLRAFELGGRSSRHPPLKRTRERDWVTPPGPGEAEVASPARGRRRFSPLASG